MKPALKKNSNLLLVIPFLILAGSSFCLAVNSEIIRHKTMEDFLKGDPNQIAIDSHGVLTLARQHDLVGEDFADSWVINTIVSDRKSKGNVLYIGTSPNGCIFRYDGKGITKIYPLDSESESNTKIETVADGGPAVDQVDGLSNETSQSDALSDQKDADSTDAKNAEDPNRPAEGTDVIEKKFIKNEHIFALGFDKEGRLLAGISGEDCRLVRFGKNNTQELLFKPLSANFIFAIVTDDSGRIFVATGPEGMIYTLEADGSDPDMLYDCRDRNVISMITDYKGSLFAGTDERGLIYKIDIEKRQATVLFDSPQSDITSLYLDEQGSILASATTSMPTRQKGPTAPPRVYNTGKDAKNGSDSKIYSQEQGGLKLQIANTSKGNDSAQQLPPRIPNGKNESAVYKISPEGFVSKVFSAQSMFLCMTLQKQEILLGTGDDSKLLAIDPETEKMTQAFSDDKSAQITSLYSHDNSLYIGLSNPARLVSLGNSIFKEGYYVSPALDAGQPARWGKLQLDAYIPDGTSVFLSSRSGNIEDTEDLSLMSSWTEPIQVKGPTDVGAPVGRFAQYKIILKGDSIKTPRIRQIALAQVVENIAPKVIEIKTISNPEKPGFMQIAFNAQDENNDNLIFKIELRLIGTDSWIELSKDDAKPVYEWDTRTVTDGTYEIRVTADDSRSNSPSTSLSASRISDPVVIDNTPPQISDINVEQTKGKITITLKAVDELSMISALAYTINSNKDWISTLPDDLVYDTTTESFTIVIDDLEQGQYVIAIKAADDPGNVKYTSVVVDVK